MSNGYYFRQYSYKVGKKLDIKDSIIDKFKLKTDLNNNHLIRFYRHLTLNQEFAPLDFLIELSLHCKTKSGP